MAGSYEHLMGKPMDAKKHPSNKMPSTVDDAEDAAEYKKTGKAPTKAEEAKEDKKKKK